jgi:hypothetical protein
MARKTGKNDGGQQLLAVIISVIAGLCFVPFLLISLIFFNSLKNRYITSTTAQRVIDIRKLGRTLTVGGILTIGWTIISFAILINLNQADISKNILRIFFIIIICSIFIIGYLFARHISVLYLGIIADKEKDVLVFPHDMQSYLITDYIMLRFISDYINVDNISLSKIIKLTRGHGTELYVHGPFGSRAIIMSSKQKRDECLAMIQDFTGRKGILITEIEGY